MRNEGKELAWEPRAGRVVRPDGRPLRRVMPFVRLLLSEDQGDCGCQCCYSVWEPEMVREGRSGEDLLRWGGRQRGVWHGCWLPAGAGLDGWGGCEGGLQGGKPVIRRGPNL